MQALVKRRVLDAKISAGALANPCGHPVPVPRPARQRFQDQQIERALYELQENAAARGSCPAEHSAIAPASDCSRLTLLGAVAAWLLGRAAQSLLFGVEAADPTALATAAAVLAAVMLAAAYVPARRASRVDPMAALRHE